MNRATILLLSGITLACFSSQYLAAADEQQQATARANYLVIYRPGPAWVAGKPVEEQPLKEHGKYMLSLYVKGSMKLAGPLTDNAGGAVLLAVANESEAKSIVMEDPAVKNGIFVYEMHPWELKPWDKYANKKK
ncbi:MAG TPA: YciI family protein [Candidatus Udaeobacter sp.]